jgi:hypothetical protein
LSATNFDGASTAATAAGAIDSLLADVTGVASSVGSTVGSALIDGAGAATSSFSDPDCDQTIIAKRIIPTTTAPRTDLDVPCFGATVGLVAVAGLEAARIGVVDTFTREDVFTPPRGTGGTTYFEAALFLAELFFATFLVVLFALFFAALFLTADFFATLFFATAFLATRFLAVDFFATDFFATAFFLAGAFFEDFFTATFTP